MGTAIRSSLGEGDEILVVLMHMQSALHSDGLLEGIQNSGEVSAVPTIDDSGKTVNRKPKSTE